MAPKGNCPVCSTEFSEGKPVMYCTKCNTPHHGECFASIGKCSMYACGSVSCTSAAPAEMSSTLPVTAGETLPAKLPAKPETLQDKLKALFVRTKSTSESDTCKEIVRFCEQEDMPKYSFAAILSHVNRIKEYMRKITGSEGIGMLFLGVINPFVWAVLGTICINLIYFWGVLLSVIGFFPIAIFRSEDYQKKTQNLLSTLKANPAGIESVKDAGYVVRINNQIDALAQTLEKLSVNEKHTLLTTSN